jgi:hypothetical protein
MDGPLNVKWLTCVQRVLVEATRLDLELVEVATHLGP